MNELQTLLSQSAMNRAKYNDRIMAQQKSAWQSAKVIGYDSSNGRYNVETTDGKIISAKAVTTGTLATGQQVALSANKHTPIIDGMPR